MDLLRQMRVIEKLLVIVILSGFAMTNASADTTDDASAIASSMIAKMQAEWNGAGDPGFSMFTEDVDFVNAFGPYWRGTAEVAKGTGNIKSAYKSVASYKLAHASEIAPGVILAIVDATATVPDGQPGAGVHPATQSILFVKHGGEWKVRFLQTTPLATPAPKAP
jgi:uncharacterized protein (TIGR02246 family)